MATAIDDFSLMNRDIRASFSSGVNQSYESRIKHLEAIRDTIIKYYNDACIALKEDLGRNPTEASVELELILSEISLCISNLHSWMEPQSKPTHMLMLPGSTEIRREPFGVVLIIGAYSHPLHLCLIPCIGAIAAGNCVIIKPSELAPSCASWLLYKFALSISKDIIRVILGDNTRTQLLLSQPYDYIFYTGSLHGGRIVSHSAAEFLTPLSLNFGGKSPVYVDETMKQDNDHILNQTAKRIVFGKFHNCGQSCWAPDYVLVHESIHEEFLDALIK